MTLIGGAAGGLGRDAIATGLRGRIPLECEGLIIGGDAYIARKHVPIVSLRVGFDKQEKLHVGRDREPQLLSGRRSRRTTQVVRLTDGTLWDG